MRQDVFEQLLESVRQMKAIQKGELAPGRVFTMEDPAEDVTALRKQLRLSQAKFAQMIGVSLRTLQNWEQGHRKPEGPARVLLRVAATHPQAVLDVVARRDRRDPRERTRTMVAESTVGYRAAGREVRRVRQRAAKKK